MSLYLVENTDWCVDAVLVCVMAMIYECVFVQGLRLHSGGALSQRDAPLSQHGGQQQVLRFPEEELRVTMALFYNLVVKYVNDQANSVCGHREW